MKSCVDKIKRVEKPCISVFTLIALGMNVYYSNLIICKCNWKHRGIDNYQQTTNHNRTESKQKRKINKKIAKFKPNSL